MVRPRRTQSDVQLPTAWPRLAGTFSAPSQRNLSRDD